MSYKSALNDVRFDFLLKIAFWDQGEILTKSLDRSCSVRS